ncbi:MAG TPA: hypothetical protein VI216_03050 [Candidatus Acidoferrales bacterium]
MQKDEVIERIRDAFSATPYPGDPFLQGSFDGSEPFEEVGAFAGKNDWRTLDSKMLDARYCALDFFSEGGFRFFLPAYLVADLREELLTAEPLFHLWHGFATVSTDVAVGSRTFHRSSGGNRPVNPRRYGAIRWSDYARHRLSVFAREEAQAIVTYMTYKREHSATDLDKSRIDAALREFWSERAENAPTRKELEVHQQEEAEFYAALQGEASPRGTETLGKKKGDNDG